MKEIVYRNELQWDSIAKDYNKRIMKEYYSDTKEKWSTEIFKHINSIKKTKLKILDVGTGPGFFPMILRCDNIEIIAIDKYPAMLEIAKRNNIDSTNVRFMMMNAEHLDFEDNVFDIIIVRNMSYTLSDPESAFREWYRVLTPGGCLLIYDANWWYFIFNEEEKNNVNNYLEEYHKKERKEHSTYEKECCQEWDSIITRPLSKVRRPDWDYLFFTSIGARKVIIDRDVSKRVNTPEEQYKSLPTPLFLVEVYK